MFGALRKKLIFTISTKVTDTTEKELITKNSSKNMKVSCIEGCISILMFVVQIL